MGLVFDDSILNTDAPSATVPDGEYLLAIKSAKTNIKEWPDDTQFRWEFAIKDGPTGIGQTLRMTTTLKSGAQFALGRLLNAVGFDPTKLVGTEVSKEADLDKLLDKLMKAVTGRELGALVVLSKPTNEGRRYSNIQETYSAEDFAERSKSNVTAPVTGGNELAADDDDVEDLAKTVADW